MINAVIIENENSAREKLVNTLKEVAPDLMVKTILTSVRESIEYFRENLLIDIIFCGVQLPDGLPFKIFNEVNLAIPVIFISRDNNFNLFAFDNNGIDYLLKPVDKNHLKRSILKYKMLEKHFTMQNRQQQKLTISPGIKKKTRLLAKKGGENVCMLLQDIVMFHAADKIVSAMDKNGQNFVTDKTLNELESELDNSFFFRANRQYIISLHFVKSYKPYERVKLLVDLNVNEKINHFIIISQITAPDFRKWISEA